MKKSKKDLSFTDMFSRGSLNEYKGIFNEKVETCFMRLIQYTWPWKKKVLGINYSQKREKQNE